MARPEDRRHLVGHGAIGVQYRTNLQHGRRSSPPVTSEFHLRHVPLFVSNREPGEHPGGLLHLNGQVGHPVGRSHRPYGLGEGGRVDDVREEVDVIRQSFQEPVRLNRVPASQDEAVSRSGYKADTGEPGVKRILRVDTTQPCGPVAEIVLPTSTARGGSHSLCHTGP